MMYSIVYHPLVVKEDIPALDSTIKARIKSAIERKLTIHPEIFGIPLRQSLVGYRKLRVGDYRIVFSLHKQRVTILAIKHRSHIYKDLLRRP